MRFLLFLATFRLRISNVLILYLKIETDIFHNELKEYVVLQILTTYVCVFLVLLFSRKISAKLVSEAVNPLKAATTYSAATHIGPESQIQIS